MLNGQNPQQYNNTGYDNPFMIYFNEFGKTYTRKPPVNPQELLEDFAQLAARRRKFSKIFLFVPLIFIAFFISPIFAFFTMAAFVVIFVIFLVGSLKNPTGSHGYTMGDYKNYVVQQALSPVVENLVYEEKIGVPKTAVKNMDITRMGNSYKTEDFITGKYHGVYFAQSDLKIWYSDDDGSTTYFKGRWIDIKYPKPFTGMVTIVDKKYTYKVKRHSYLEPIALENPEFNNSFIVESNNQQLAYYLLTPQIMERLMYLKQNSKGDIIACFMDGYLHLGINNGQDAFEPNIRNVNLYGDIEKTKYDFSLVSGLIEILSIDNNVYVDRQQVPQGGNMYPPQQNVQQPQYSYPSQRNIDRF